MKIGNLVYVAVCIPHHTLPFHSPLNPVTLVGISCNIFRYSKINISNCCFCLYHLAHYCHKMQHDLTKLDMATKNGSYYESYTIFEEKPALPLVDALTLDVALVNHRLLHDVLPHLQQLLGHQLMLVEMDVIADANDDEDLWQTTTYLNLHLQGQ